MTQMAQRRRNGHEIKLPPYAEGAEQGLIGCVLLKPELFAKTRETVDLEYFYDLRHRTIWEAIDKCDSKGPWDLVVLQQRMKDEQTLEASGGIGYLSSLMDATPSAENWEMYLREMNAKYIGRRGLAT